MRTDRAHAARGVFSLEINCPEASCVCGPRESIIFPIVISPGRGSLRFRPLRLERLYLDVFIPAVRAMVLQADISGAGMLFVNNVKFVGSAIGAFVLFGELVEVDVVDLLSI